MSLPEIREAVHAWTGQGQRWGEAVLIRVRRSAPRLPGARYAVAADGSFAGTISAGCVEADLREHILSLLADANSPRARWVSYGISDEMAAGVGLACGGEIDVLIRAHEPDDEIWLRLVEMLDDETDPRGQGALVTGLADSRLGEQVLVLPDGSMTGDVAGVPWGRLLAAEMDLLFSREGAEGVEIAPGHPVFVDRVLPPRRLVVVGATPIAAALASLASTAGYRVIIVDPREGLADSAPFAGAELRVEWPTEAFEDMAVDEWTDVAVLAHEERLDVPALRSAIAGGCRYVGLLGGRRTQKARREVLRAEGVPASELDRIRGPIGLDIGAVGPAEIAVSILAEMLALRRQGISAP